MTIMIKPYEAYFNSIIMIGDEKYVIRTCKKMKGLEYSTNIYYIHIYAVKRKVYAYTECLWH